jgi:hypothetical protein
MPEPELWVWSFGTTFDHSKSFKYLSQYVEMPGTSHLASAGAFGQWESMGKYGKASILSVSV